MSDSFKTAFTSVNDFCANYIMDHCKTEEDLVALASVMVTNAATIYRRLAGSTHVIHQLESVIENERKNVRKH